MKTPVCITIDTEFSIGGAFNAPERNKPIGKNAVWCEIDKRSHGLGVLLETLERYNFFGTFFVEALNTHYFGDDEMGNIAGYIADRGHDVQLHLHPCWSAFKDPDWQHNLARSTPNDSMAGRSERELKEFLQSGIDTFSRWGLAKPVALRTGNLHVDRSVYKTMSMLNIPFSSNIGNGHYQPEDAELRLDYGCHQIEGICEVPILSYSDFKFASVEHRKIMTIIGCSFRELVKLLNKAHKNRIGPVVILTHPFEFVIRGDNQYKHLAANPKTQNRLDKLCKYLQQHRDRFEVMTFKQGSELWESDAYPMRNSVSVSPLHFLERKFLPV